MNAEKKANFYSKMFIGAGYVTLILMLSSPFINMFIELQSTGEITKSRWDLPYKML